jgi:hypothetical protein
LKAANFPSGLPIITTTPSGKKVVLKKTDNYFAYDS